MMDAETNDGQHQVLIPGWKVFMFQLFTVLSYANSAVNPLLYVFVNEDFRQKCIAASCPFRTGSSQQRQPPVVRVTPTTGVPLRCGIQRSADETPATGASIELLPIPTNDVATANADITVGGRVA